MMKSNFCHIFNSLLLQESHLVYTSHCNKNTIYSDNGEFGGIIQDFVLEIWNKTNISSRI